MVRPVHRVDVHRGPADREAHYLLQIPLRNFFWNFLRNYSFRFEIWKGADSPARCMNLRSTLCEFFLLRWSMRAEAKFKKLCRNVHRQHHKNSTYEFINSQFPQEIQGPHLLEGFLKEKCFKTLSCLKYRYDRVYGCPIMLSARGSRWKYQHYQRNVALRFEFFFLKVIVNMISWPKGMVLTHTITLICDSMISHKSPQEQQM